METVVDVETAGRVMSGTKLCAACIPMKPNAPQSLTSTALEEQKVQNAAAGCSTCNEQTGARQYTKSAAWR